MVSGRKNAANIDRNRSITKGEFAKKMERNSVAGDDSLKIKERIFQDIERRKKEVRSTLNLLSEGKIELTDAARSISQTYIDSVPLSVFLPVVYKWILDDNPYVTAQDIAEVEWRIQDVIYDLMAVPNADIEFIIKDRLEGPAKRNAALRILDRIDLTNALYNFITKEVQTEAKFTILSHDGLIDIAYNKAAVDVMDELAKHAGWSHASFADEEGIDGILAHKTKNDPGLIVMADASLGSITANSVEVIDTLSKMNILTQVIAMGDVIEEVLDGEKE